MPAIIINMLNRFDILVDGVSAASYIENSSKSIALLKYLILNKNRAIPVTSLIDIFWSESENNSNPESALSTMISRLRNNLARANPIFKDCIIFQKKTYCWNNDIDCEIDVFKFETLCKSLQKETVFNESIKAKYIQAIDLYTGDLSNGFNDEDWILTKSLYYNQLYFRTLYQFIDLLKEDEDYELIINVCCIALDLDILDETINLELMNALSKCGHNNMAIMKYRNFTTSYSKYLGEEPSNKMQEFYKELIKQDQQNEKNVNIILNNLKSVDISEDGAYICDYSIFKDIYSLQLRNFRRNERKMYLVLIHLKQYLDDIVEPLVIDRVMLDLLEILKQCLRKGDTISRYSSSQFVVLLPMMNYSDGSIATNRIRSMFYAKHSEKIVNISFQLESI